MRDLVAIKIKARMSATSTAYEYPDWKQLSDKVWKGIKHRTIQEQAKYFERYGISMFYDPCDMGDVDAEVLEYDVRYVGTCVPSDFARAAAKRFPNLVTILTPEEWEAWYDTRLACDQPDEIVDLKALQVIEILEALAARNYGKRPTQAKIHKALDPKDSTPGVIENPNKTWARLSKKKGVNLV